MRPGAMMRARGRRPTPLRAIRLLLLDVDGVMTDGRLHYGPTGEIEKSFHVRDGYGIKAAQSAGLTIAVLSGRRSRAVQRRCRELGIRELHQGVQNKAALFERLTARLAIPAWQCACIGDDVPDVALFERVGLAVAVAGAHESALAAAHRCTRLPGGAGAVREVCDWLLAARRRRQLPRARGAMP